MSDGEFDIIVCDDTSVSNNQLFYSAVAQGGVRRDLTVPDNDRLYGNLFSGVRYNVYWINWLI